MQASEKLVLVYLAVLSAIAMASEVPRPLRDLRGHSNEAPVRLSTILTNEVTSNSEGKTTRLMGGHLRITTTASPGEDDEAQWDDGLTLSSAGNGKENKKPRDDDDEKKTLAQQVKEGKYGLIQNELYPKKSKRPGILSYLSNPEVPKDTKTNYGGLDKDEIWLAENHMLVLRGGSFPEHDTEQPSGDLRGWSPIDDFQAPKRQVKIPTSPKIPPPFPVQLTEGGPVTVLGANDTNKPQWFDGLLPANETFLMSDWTNTTDEKSQTERKTKSGLSLGGIVGPFFPSPPSGAVFLPPPGNQSDYDEDDQAIYYPPAYSFKYTQDNSTAVPPGPLVPGIILPPPPGFFYRQEEKETTKSHISKYPKRPSTTAKPVTNIHRKSHPKPHKFTSSSSTSSTKEPRPFTMKPLNKFKQKNITSSSMQTTNTAKQVLPFVEVTTSAPDEMSTLEITEVTTVRPIVTNQVIDTSRDDQNEKPRWTGSTLTSSPIVAYYPSSPSPIDEAVEILSKTTKPRKVLPPVPTSASYYFYEEANDDVSGSTPTPIYFEETTTSRIEDYTVPNIETKRPYYPDVTNPQPTHEQYNVKGVPKLVKPSTHRFHYRNENSPILATSPRSQSQRVLSDSSIFYEPVTERPRLNLESYFTTSAPATYSQSRQTKSKTIYEDSFEATGAAPRSREKELYPPIQQVQPQKKVTFNEWQEEIQDVGKDYGDYGSEPAPEQVWQPEPETSHYKINSPGYPRTKTILNDPRTIINTEPTQDTKQEDRILDKVITEYFNNFGRRINNNRLRSTTLIGESFSTNSFDEKRKSYTTPAVEVSYGDPTSRPFDLEGDTRVNYQRPLPSVNPDAEFLPGYDPKQRNEGQKLIERYRPSKPISQYIPVNDYRQQIQDNTEPTGFVPLKDERKGQRVFPSRPISLISDININYRDPRPPINPDAEYIDPVNTGQSSQDKPSSYFEYRLPGDGGHFYFLTPHANSQRQEDNSFVYPRPMGTRFARQRRLPRNV